MRAPDVGAFIYGRDAFACRSKGIGDDVVNWAQRSPVLRDGREPLLEASPRGRVVCKAFGAGAYGYAFSSAGLAEPSETVASNSPGGRYIGPVLGGRGAEPARVVRSPRE